MRRVLLQPAYVLHRRPYRETSFLVDLFTKEYGRMTVVASGVRKLKSATQGIIQPFIPLIVSWSGKGELVSLTHIETQGHTPRLTGDCLLAGFYLNELLMILLQKWDAYADIYQRYAETMPLLAATTLDEKILRRFEMQLLSALGYGVMHYPFQPDTFYRFMPEHGFIESDFGQHVFSGTLLQQIANDDWRDSACLLTAKRLMRYILTPLLGSRPLVSRQLFLQPEETSDESTAS